MLNFKNLLSFFGTYVAETCFGAVFFGNKTLWMKGTTPPWEMVMFWHKRFNSSSLRIALKRGKVVEIPRIEHMLTKELTSTSDED